jgi:hypothetical protein
LIDTVQLLDALVAALAVKAAIHVGIKLNEDPRITTARVQVWYGAAYQAIASDLATCNSYSRSGRPHIWFAGVAAYTEDMDWPCPENVADDADLKELRLFKSFKRDLCSNCPFVSDFAGTVNRDIGPSVFHFLTAVTMPMRATYSQSLWI